ncbi:DNA primase [Paenibacillus swuensis]|uniref:DNA primase n=1 Tax=Paenibacillus swuensis TaxID=1178515 RepID=A0A172TJU5_9BACL|nr:DNA primase [Paenibacillus swuensis]ANE47329.1 DNA primase [Paenibacillus swuensis]
MSNGSIPDEVIEAVLKHHDIVDTVGKYVHLSKNGKYMKGLCPFHSEKTPSFTVTPEKQIFKCYGCGAGGNSIGFIMQIEGYSFPEAVRAMAEDAEVNVQWEDATAEQTEKQKERQKLLDAYDLASRMYHFLLKNTEHGREAMDYLKGRGFSDKLIDHFQIGYAPPQWDTLSRQLTKREFPMELMKQGGLLLSRNDGSPYDLFRDRIMFPIWDARGRVVAFGGRILGEGGPKYLNSSESSLFHKSRTLYNFNHARPTIRKSRELVLFEGYVDVIKAWDAGIHNGVATMGTSLTEENAFMMHKNVDRIILCYDGDDAGRAAAYKNLSLLEKSGCEVKVALLPDRMDPDEYIGAHGGERFVREVIHDAVTSLKFKLIYLRKNHILIEDTGRIKYIQEALKLIAPLHSPMEREHYLKELAEEFDQSPETLKQELHQIRLEMQKLGTGGDNLDNPWNNVMNEKRVEPKTPSLLPAYHNAERKLLAMMIHDAEVAEYVQPRLGDQFNVEVHAALAAYLYAYYAQGKEPDPSKYMSTLQDDLLERAASGILMLEFDHGAVFQVIDDYIREIKKFPRMAASERLKEEMHRAERAGDFIKAAQIASEIITLERQQK